MDKKQLNQEIILCRSVVKKAKVCVIRKLIKKIKILRSCKNEELKEKKFRKGRRLAAEIHVMKELRPDYVTKFALLTENYTPTGSNTKLKRKRNACAKLIKHKELSMKINAIRDKFSNWQEELPPLLESSKKKDKTKEEETNLEANEIDQELNDVNTKVLKPKEIPYDNIQIDQVFNDVNTKVLKPKEISNDSENKDENKNLCERLGASDHEEGTENETCKTTIVKIKNKQPLKVPASDLSQSEPSGEVKKKRKKDNDNEIKNKNEDVVEEKMDDPFFIGKKVIVPKLMQKGNEDHPENKTEKKRIIEDINITDNQKSSKVVKETISTEYDIHPSWKAKKIQMIRPFEGKKIKFE